MIDSRDSIARYVEAQASRFELKNPNPPTVVAILRALASDIDAKLDLPDAAKVGDAEPGDSHDA